MRPLALSLVNSAAGAFDRAVTAAVRHAQERRYPDNAPWSQAERLAMLESLRRTYDRRARARGGFFPAPRPAEPRLRHVRHAPYGALVADAEWPSHYEPLLGVVREPYMQCRENHTAHARLFLHPQPRPAAILVHGYLGGHYRFEEFAFPLPWLYRLGFDVALFVLPFHARRAAPGRGGAPPFPGNDPRFTIEGFRQAMGDFGALVGWLRGRGAPSVGVMGMSLGGYTTALAATLDPDLSFAVPLIPLACLADYAHDNGRLGPAAEATALHRALRAAYEPVNPLGRPPLVPAERVLVVGAQGDAITPLRHAERLAGHFGAPLYTFAGGHLMQVGVRGAWRRIKAFWRERGLIAPPAERRRRGCQTVFARG